MNCSTFIYTNFRIQERTNILTQNQTNNKHSYKPLQMLPKNLTPISKIFLRGKYKGGRDVGRGCKIEETPLRVFLSLSRYLYYILYSFKTFFKQIQHFLYFLNNFLFIFLIFLVIFNFFSHFFIHV